MSASTSVHRLVYHVTTTRTPVLEAVAPVSAAPGTSEEEIVVLLSENWQSHREGAIETIVDTAKGRIHHVDHEAGTVDERAIYADVAFREAEVANRLMLLQIIEVGGASAGTREGAEASLGIEFDPSQPPGIRNPEIQRDCWMLGSTEVARHEPSQHTVPVHVLRRWFAYEVMLHPRIAEHIARQGQMPAELIHRLRLVPELYERRWVLSSCDEVEVDREASLRGRKRAPPVDEGHARVQALASSRSTATPSRVELAKEALAQGRELPALLGLLAHTIATVDDCEHEFRELRQQITESSPAFGFTLLMELVSSGQQTEEMVEWIDRFEPMAGSMSHILGIFRANVLVSLLPRVSSAEQRAEMLEQAQESLLHALEVDPGLTGAYKDLGDLFAHRYLTGVAWELFDLGRALVPEHHIFTGVHEYEQRLRQAHPEFF